MEFDVLFVLASFKGQIEAREGAPRIENVEGPEKCLQNTFFGNFASLFDRLALVILLLLLRYCVLENKSCRLSAMARETEAVYRNSAFFRSVARLFVRESVVVVVICLRRVEVLPETRKFESAFSTPDPHKLFLRVC